MVQEGARINRCDRWGGSPLDDAHRHRHWHCVEYLRSLGGAFGSSSQATNFIAAASEGDDEEVATMLRLGNININEGDNDRRTALHAAAGNGHLTVIKLLCESGANVNVLIDGVAVRLMTQSFMVTKNAKSSCKNMVPSTGTLTLPWEEKH